MDKTKKLKNIILDKYGSIREFARISKIPSTTLTSALDKGIGGMAVDRVIKICEILDIDIKTFESLNEDEELILSFGEKKLLSDFNKLNNFGKNEAIKRVDELTEINKYVKDDVDHLIPIAAHHKENANMDKAQKELEKAIKLAEEIKNNK
ncbi:XRE family transcriptional regulator [Clostridium botulinum]|nr:XRE family transcriptional regulator [Clostridium botulinum]